MSTACSLHLIFCEILRPGDGAQLIEQIPSLKAALSQLHPVKLTSLEQSEQHYSLHDGQTQPSSAAARDVENQENAGLLSKLGFLPAMDNSTTQATSDHLKKQKDSIKSFCEVD